MPIDTDLNQSPFFDDFDETKNYHRVLFRPAVPVQARELTQLQTILQNQIERFGDHIFIEGTIIKGCTFFLDREYYYAKVLDQTVDGIDINLDAYSNTLLVDDLTGLKAIIVDTRSGLQSSSTGDFNTLYFKYLNVGTGGESQLANNSTLTIYNRNYSIESVLVVEGGNGYVNGDVVAFTSAVGANANAYVVTYANSTIKEIVITNKGANYTVAPTAVVAANSTGGNTTGAGASLTVRNYIDQVVVPSNSYSASVGSPVGKGYAFKVSDGIIYQKGNFVRVEPQTIIVSKYDLNPNNVVVGFRTSESIVNNSIDSTLVDNALGFTNANAPGAYRLKLTPELTSFTREAAAANNEFFTLIEFENGQPVRQRQTAAYSELNDEFARRTYEESGNYVVRKFNILTEDHPTDATKLNAVVGSGLGYVNGYRVELFDNIRIPFDKGTTSLTVENVNVVANYGNYVVVNEYKGLFDLAAPQQVSLRDTAGTDVTDAVSAVPSNPGNQIGTAYVKSVVYESGTIGTPSARYRVYLYNVAMNAGMSFDSVRAITVNGTAIADIVLDYNASTNSNIAVLKETRFNTGLFNTGIFASKDYSDETFVYRTKVSTTFSTGGVATIDVGANYDLPYTLNSELNSAQELDFIIVPSKQALSTARTGTVAGTTGANTLSGSGTAFLSEYQEGDYISVNGEMKLVSKVTNNTSMSLLTNLSSSPAANVHYRAFPNNTPVALSRVASKITIDTVDQNKAVIDLGIPLQATMTASVITNAVAYNYKKTKAITKNAYVKIANTSIASAPTGPWNIGLPDVHKLVAVYKTSNNSTYDTATDVTSSFVLDNGQRDTHYGLATIRKASGSALALDGSTNLVVVVDVFTHGVSGGYFTVDSYPTSNSTPVEANKISWSELPSYTSVGGVQYDLRDAIDTRIVASNTVAVTSVLANANVATQGVSETFATAVYPAPNQVFNANISKNLPRQDLVVIDTRGTVTIVNGQPSAVPAAPQSPAGTIVLAKLNIPPFPTVSSTSAARVPRYTTSILPSQNKRYTMKDIELIDNKITQLQYYSLLSTLEKDTKNINLPSESNTAVERFKNGFIADPLFDYRLVDLSSDEYKAAIDPVKAEATPTFNHNKFDLQIETLSNMTHRGDAVLLDYTPRILIEQPVATKYRNPVEALWSFQGALYIEPAYDNYVSTTSNPVVMDFSAWQNGLIDNINNALEYIHINQTSNTSTSTSASASWWNPESAADGHSGARNQTITQTTTTTDAWNYVQLAPGSGGITTANVGSFVTDINLNPYMKGREIVFMAVGLRPGARHYAFFDSKSVEQHIAPATIAPGYTGGKLTKDSIVLTGPKGSELYADDNGVVCGIYYLPDNTFFTGERELLITDIDTLNSLSSTTSKATAKYNAFNLDVTKSNVTTTSLNMAGATVSLANVVQTSTSTSSWTRVWDPLAQSFLLSDEIARQGEGLYLTDVDMYFKKKDTTRGLVIEVRTVELGVPTQIKVASKRVPPSAVLVSNTASQATRITFDTPVFLKAGLEYAVVVIPEANSPEYLIWTGEAGGTDVLNPALVKNQDWNQGAMFISTNASTWTAFQKEDIKFSLYFADFNSTTGSVKFTNDDREFLTLSSVSGSFIQGEDVVAKTNTYISKALTTTTSSNIITAPSAISAEVSVNDKLLLIHDSGSVANGSGTVSANGTTIIGSNTAFGSYLSAGNYIVINSNTLRKVVSVANSTQLTVDSAVVANNVVYHKLVPNYDVVSVSNVVTVSNTTTITLNKYPKFASNTTNSVFAEKGVFGVVDYVDATGSIIHLKNSNAANNAFRFAADSVLVGGVSNTVATVASVDDEGISYFDTLITTVAQPGTSVTITANVMSSSNSLVSGTYHLNDRNYLTYDGKVRSRSNEIAYGLGTKSFGLTVSCSSDQSTVSPYIGASPASILRYQYNVNNTVVGETGSSGSAAAKYISKQVVLADGQEAEDLKVYVTAYKPVGTNVQVYARILNETDSDVFTNKDWTLLTQTSANVYSSSSNKYDYREFEYTFPSEPLASTIDQRVTTNSSNTVTTTVDFRSASSPTIANNDVLIFENAADGTYNIRTVTNVDATHIYLSSAVSFSNTGVIVKKVTQVNGAFKNYENGAEGVVRYFNDSLGAFDGYKIVALKVVMLSDSYSLVPRLDDVRAIACSV